jgi:type IV pilus assembly protein PilM
MKSSQNCQRGIDPIADVRTTRAGGVRCGFTLIEIILVVVILAIAAMMAVPFATSGATMQLKSAANIIASDLEFAKSMAISRGRIYSVVFNAAGESYQIKDANDVVIKHPVNIGSDYVVSFANDSRLDQVDITGVNFDTTNTVKFDYRIAEVLCVISFNFTNRNSQTIGLDVGNNTINMVPLSGNGSPASVLAADKVRIDADTGAETATRNEAIASAIKQVMARGRFVGRNVVTSLPSEQLHITSLRLPPMDEKGLKNALREEARDRFGLDSDLDVISHFAVGEVQHGEGLKNELIMFAANHQAIQNHINLIEKAELIPVGIDPRPCALFRSFIRSLRRQEDREKTIVFVDLSSRFTTVVFGRGGEIGFVKEIPIGDERFDTQISEKLGIGQDEARVLRASLRSEKGRGSGDGRMKGNIDPSTRQVIVDVVTTVAQELAREISLCFKYYTVTFRGKRVQRAIFAGGGSYESILLNVLKRQLTVEIEVAEPFRGFDMTNVNFASDRRSNLCEWAVAVGLGLKPVLN